MFLPFQDKSGRTIKKFQYTAIYGATHNRALKIYDRYNVRLGVGKIDLAASLA